MLSASFASSSTLSLPALPSSPNTVATPPPLPAPIDPLAAPIATADAARAVNASMPFVSGPVVAAPAFRMSGSVADREAATTCLASAVWYEAGGDRVGQQAVAQVVLNRLRHPAFPKTVCGVVFQGSARSTGCQFTFTCDGSLMRKPPDAEWRDARRVASAALSGFVDKSVGLATHYHTDWVVPYWSATLDKLAQVHTHIFYRWRGWWGTKAAFAGRYSGSENLDAQIVGLADQSKLPPPAITAPQSAEAEVAANLPAPPVSIDVPGVAPGALKGALVRLADTNANVFVLDVSDVHFPGDFAMAALNLCNARTHCEVVGVTETSSLPARLPLGGSLLQHAAFVYEKNDQAGINRAQWNCHQFPRPEAQQCMATTGATQVAAVTP